jgi:TetR/AcrR family tetracycline transcriptional repressor
VADRLLALADPDLLTGRRTWQRRIGDYAVSLRTVLLDRPGAIALFHSAPMTGPTALRVGELLLATFTRAGLSDVDASRATYAVITYVLGAVALSNADAGTEEERAARLSAVPADDFPLSARTAPVAASWNGEEQFHDGPSPAAGRTGLDGRRGQPVRPRKAARTRAWWSNHASRSVIVLLNRPKSSKLIAP